jgi:hypothetical protein
MASSLLAGGAKAVSVEPMDSSCWVGSDLRVLHLAQDGSDLWRGEGFSAVYSVSASPGDGSCWVADRGNYQVVHLVVLGDIFPDVNHYYWAHDYIVACHEAGIVQGYWDGTYRPEEAVTRAQMAVYLSRALAGGDAEVPAGPETATFPDVPTDHWAFKYIEYCYDQAVVQGYWDGYHPDEVVNRAQMAVYVARALVAPWGDAVIPPPVPPPTFPDVSSHHWAWKWVEFCHDQGVVQGYWDGYHPAEVVNRAQIAVYVQRAFDLPM